MPADSTHWNTLFDAITAAEKLIFSPFASSGSRIIEAVGYAPGSAIPVASKTYSLDGTLSGAYAPAPGDCAAIVRYSTPDKSSKNHPVYCFNYYHSAHLGSGGTDADTLLAGQRTAMATYGAAWLTGFSDGTNTYKRSRPTGDLCTGVLVLPMIGHRDLPH